MKHLSTKGLGFASPTGRRLVRGLTMRIDADHVAVVGRNGVGKSTLLQVLAGQVAPSEGRVERSGSLRLVPQVLRSQAASLLSPGELRREILSKAFTERPDFLLLDEPSQDLDREGATWLHRLFQQRHGALIVVTHDRRLLRHFDAFFVVAESGCRLVTGGIGELLIQLEEERDEANRKYAEELSRLVTKEQHNAKTRRRSARKRAGGRVRELDRCPARANLNAKRGYAQVYQSKREGVRADRIAAARKRAKVARRALAVELPLQLSVTDLPPDSEPAIIRLRGATTARLGEVRLPPQDLQLSRQRLAIVGPNGSGKSTLLQVMMGELLPDEGHVRVQWERVGYIAQHAANWTTDESLVSLLLTHSNACSEEDVAKQLHSHKFPLALAERPLRSLSPGERTRAALITLFHKNPHVELLVLDEPTDQLDLLGLQSLERTLRVWPGGLVVVSHDEKFLQTVRVEGRIEMMHLYNARMMPPSTRSPWPFMARLLVK